MPGAPRSLILVVVSDTAANHRSAADRHEAAAENHERAAGFWDGRGERERAELQRQMAEYERRGAALEYRWAELTDPGAALGAIRAAELVTSQMRQGANRLSGILSQSAEMLEVSAGLAEEHACRREQAGRDPAGERDAAERAHAAARRARSQAEEWRNLVEGQKG